MTSPASRFLGSTARRATVIVDREHDEFREALNARIAMKAYELFEAEGGIEGRELAHWVQAESEVLLPISDIRDSAGLVTVDVPLHGTEPEQVRVLVEPRRAIFQIPNAGKTSPAENSEDFSYRMAQWQLEADPSTSRTHTKSGILTLSLRQAGRAESPAAKTLKQKLGFGR
jgi:Protein of unknown function (DUF2934)